MVKGARAKARKAEGTRELIVEATLDTLKQDGFVATSARVIALRGGFNQALIFYHFGSLNDLLIAALDETSRRRLDHYRAAIEAAGSRQELLDFAASAHEEDVRSGHVTVLTEMLAGSASDPGLRAAIATRVEPWIDLAESAIAKVLEGSPLVAMLPTRELAEAVVAFYLGLDLLSHIGVKPPTLLLDLAKSSIPLVAGFTQ